MSLSRGAYGRQRKQDIPVTHVPHERVIRAQETVCQTEDTLLNRVAKEALLRW